MKKLSILILAITMILVIAGCGGNLSRPANGTYRSEGLIPQTWTFSGSNEITLSAGGIISTRGTYTISGNRLTVTTSMFGVDTTTVYTITEITRNSFFIDGTRFVRQ
ncbi:MAG: hypothetical protein FWC96_00765 [Oscillospiraceae bacterium]|nr:hypothetical protein [Oscillospiraceae bacterium]